MLQKITKLSLAFVGAAFLSLETNTRATAANFTPEPLYERTASYTTTIPTSKGTVDETDIYYPILPQSSTQTLPVALFLPGWKIDKSLYSNYAKIVASYGFIVVIPNHFQFIPQLGVKALLPETSQIGDFVEFVATENSHPNSPIQNTFKTNKLALLGHSAGGSVGLTAIDGNCLVIFCQEEFTLSDKFSAAAFYGTQLPDLSTGNIFNAKILPTNNDSLPIALIHGERDGAISPQRGRKTYELIEAPPKAFILIEGANHRSITKNLKKLQSPPPHSEVRTDNLVKETTVNIVQLH